MIDLYLPKRKLAVEVDEFGQKKREQKKKENKRQKELEVHLRCVFLRINTDEKDLSAYDGLGKIQTFIKR